ncbi:MAG: LPS export ABC transporter periplasmic protein LptC [Thiomargarita sp.]|nr:LPS export ABC transporter periplasmic protein LptC [Thiomargarita sp.]
MQIRSNGWIILIILAMTTTWLMYSLDEKVTTTIQYIDRLPDYTMENFTSIQMDEQGYVKSHLMADKMLYYPDKSTELTAPVITFYKNTQATWIVQSERGKISADGQQAWLLGHTVAEKQVNSDNSEPQAIKIISQDVTIQLNTEYAETNAPTTIISSNGEIKGVGMQLSLPKEQIKLFSKVQGKYHNH